MSLASERVEVDPEPWVDRRLDDAAGVLEPVDTGLGSVAAPIARRWPVTLQTERVRLVDDRPQHLDRHHLAHLDRHRPTLVEDADDPPCHVFALDPDEVVASRRRDVEPVAGEEDPRPVGATGLDLVRVERIQAMSLPTSLTVVTPWARNSSPIHSK